MSEAKLFYLLTVFYWRRPGKPTIKPVEPKIRPSVYHRPLPQIPPQQHSLLQEGRARAEVCRHTAHQSDRLAGNMLTYRKHVLRRTLLPFVVLLAVTGLAQGLAISGVQQDQKIQEVNISKDTENSSSAREAKYLNFKTLVSGQSNEIDTDTPTVKEGETDNPVTAFSGIYSDCITEFSFSCVQRKVLVFFDRLGRMDSFDLLGDFVSVVRTRPDTTPKITEDGLKARLYAGGDVESDMESLMDLVADRFFSSHVLRVRLPAWSQASVPGDVEVARTGTTVDISFGNYLDEEGKEGKYIR